MTDGFDEPDFGELFLRKHAERSRANRYPDCTGLTCDQYWEETEKMLRKLSEGGYVPPENGRVIILGTGRKDGGFGDEGKKEEDMDEE